MSVKSAEKALESKLAKLGYPREFALVLAQELRGEKSILRMVGYLNAAKHVSMEEIVDEMLAIQQDAAQWQRKKIMEANQAKYNLLMQNGLDEEDV